MLAFRSYLLLIFIVFTCVQALPVTETSLPSEGITSESPCGDVEVYSDLLQDHEGDVIEKTPTVVKREPTSLEGVKLPEDLQTRDGLGYELKTGIIYMTTTKVVYLTETVEMAVTTAPDTYAAGKPTLVKVTPSSTPYDTSIMVDYSAVTSLSAPYQTVIGYPVQTISSSLYQYLTVQPVMKPTYPPSGGIQPTITKTVTKLRGPHSSQKATTAPVKRPSTYPAPVDIVPSTSSRTRIPDPPTYIETIGRFGETTSKPITTVPITATHSNLADISPSKPPPAPPYPLPTGNHTKAANTSSIFVSPTEDPSGRVTPVPTKLQKTSLLNYTSTLITDYPSVTISAFSTMESDTPLGYISTAPTTTDNNPANITPNSLSYPIPSNIPYAPQMEVPAAIMNEGNLNLDQFGDYVATELGGKTIATGVPNAVDCRECGEAMDSGAGRLGLHMSETSLWVIGMINLGGLVMLW